MESATLRSRGGQFQVSQDPTSGRSGSDGSDPARRSEISDAMLDRIQVLLDGLSLYRPGQRIGAYELIEQIGKGAQSRLGEVWLASGVDSGLKVAIKFVRSDLAEREQLIERFKRVEARTLARFAHPNIARFLESGTHNGLPYLVMEYVAGGDILHYANKNRLTVPERLRLVAQVCEALHHVHLEHIFHRDLKPANIMIEPAAGPNVAPTPKLIDFGIACSDDPANPISTAVQTMYSDDGTGVGTYPYLAPEQFSSSRPELRTRQSEVYQLGAVLFEVLVGVSPMHHVFQNTSDGFERRARLRDEDRPGMLEAFAALPDSEQHRIAEERSTTVKGLQRILGSRVARISDRALRMNPKRRFSDAKTMALDIGNYLGSRDFIEAANEGRGERWLRNAKRHRKLLAGVATVALLLGVTLTIAFNAVRSEKENENRTKQDLEYISYLGAISRAGMAWQRLDLAGLRSELRSIQELGRKDLESRFEFRMLQAQSRPAIAEFTRAAGACSDVAISPDGSYVYYCSDSDTLKVGSDSGAEVREFDCSDRIDQLRMSGDGYKLILKLRGQRPRLVAVDTRDWPQEVAELQEFAEVDGLASWNLADVSSNGRWIALREANDRLWILDAQRHRLCPTGDKGKRATSVQFVQAEGDEWLCVLDKAWSACRVEEFAGEKPEFLPWGPESPAFEGAGPAGGIVLPQGSIFERIFWTEENGYSEATLWRRGEDGRWLSTKLPQTPASEFRVVNEPGGRATRVIALDRAGRMSSALVAGVDAVTSDPRRADRQRQPKETARAILSSPRWEGFLPAHDGQVACLRVASAGRLRWVTSGKSDCAVRVWEAGCEAPLSIADVEPTSEIAIDGDLLATQKGEYSTFAGNRIGGRGWSEFRSKLPYFDVLPIAGGRTLAVDWSGSGQVLLAGADMRELRSCGKLLDAAASSSRLEYALQALAPTNLVQARRRDFWAEYEPVLAAASRDGSRVAVFDKTQGSLRVWSTLDDSIADVPTEFGGGESPVRLAVSADGKWLAVATARSSGEVAVVTQAEPLHAAVYLYDLETRARVWSEPAVKNALPSVTTMVFDASGRLGWGGTGYAFVWDGKALQNLSGVLGEDEEVKSMDLKANHDEALLAFVNQNGVARLIDVKSKFIMLTISVRGAISAIGFDPNGSGIALAVDGDRGSFIEVLSTLSAEERRGKIRAYRRASDWMQSAAASETETASESADALPGTLPLAPWLQQVEARVNQQLAQLRAQVGGLEQVRLVECESRAWRGNLALMRLPLCQSLLGFKVLQQKVDNGATDCDWSLLHKPDSAVVPTLYLMWGTLTDLGKTATLSERTAGESKMKRLDQVLSAALETCDELPRQGASVDHLKSVAWETRSVIQEHVARELDPIDGPAAESARKSAVDFQRSSVQFFESGGVPADQHRLFRSFLREDWVARDPRERLKALLSGSTTPPTPN